MPFLFTLSGCLRELKQVTKISCSNNKGLKSHRIAIITEKHQNIITLYPLKTEIKKGRNTNINFINK